MRRNLRCQLLFSHAISIIEESNLMRAHNLPAFYVIFSLIVVLLSPTTNAEPAPTTALSLSPLTNDGIGADKHATPSRRNLHAPTRLGRYGAESQTTSPDSLSPLTKPVKVLSSVPTQAPSDSIGTATAGYMSGAKEMSLTHECWDFIPSAKRRKTNYGTTDLIDALQRGAKEVAASTPEKSRMLLGNLSFKEGGDLPWSKSHNSGRDADVAFYSTYPDGTPVKHNHFVRFNRRAQGHVNGKKVHFDTARNWGLVKSLLENDTIQVQWMFLANPLRRKLLKYAEKVNTPPQLLEKAKKVLKQPSDSSPHRDHFHIRLYCSLEDTLTGCANTGPSWDWVDLYETEREAHLVALGAQLLDTDPAQRKNSLHQLTRLQSKRYRKTLISMAQGDTDKAVKIAAYKALRRLHSPLSTSLLRSFTKSGPTPIRTAAIRALGKRTKKTDIPLLIAHLGDEERAIRDAVREALRFATNFDLSVPKGEGPAHLRLQSAWKAWYAKNKGEMWEQWIREGFEAKGIRFRGRMLRHGSIPILIKLTRKGSHLGYNAQRMLRKVTKRNISLSTSVGSAAYSRWKKWWKRNYRRYGHRSARI